MRRAVEAYVMPLLSSFGLYWSTSFHLSWATRFRPNWSTGFHQSGSTRFHPNWARVTMAKLLHLGHTSSFVSDERGRGYAWQKEGDHGHPRDIETRPGGQSDRAVAEALNIDRVFCFVLDLCR